MSKTGSSQIASDRPAGRRRRGRGFLTFLVVVAALAAVLYGSALFLVDRETRVHVASGETTPAAYDLPDSTVSFESADGVPLQAWWIRVEEPRAAVILIHGARYDASSMLGHARFLRDAGYSVLDLDLRAHGRSGGGRTGLSLTDTRDVEAAVDWIRAQPGLAHTPVALLGVSSGGATALRVASERHDVGAVVSVSAPSSPEDAMAETLRARNVPGPVAFLYAPFLRLAVYTIYHEWPTRAAMATAIGQNSPRRVLIAHGRADHEIPPVHAERLAEMVGGKAELWFVDGAGHGIVQGEVNAPENSLYRIHVLGFLDRAFPQPLGLRHRGEKKSRRAEQALAKTAEGEGQAASGAEGGRTQPAPSGSGDQRRDQDRNQSPR